MKTEKILFVAVIAVLVLSAVQGLQLLNIRSDLGEGSLSVSSAPANAPSVGGASSPQRTAIDIQADIPDQVGGCF